MIYPRPTLLLAAAASAFAFFAAPTLAQSYHDDDEIIVRGPAVERYRTGERSSIGAPIEELVLQRVISTRGLDLRRDEDVDELYRRIHFVAADSCAEIERVSQGVPLTTERQCVRHAVRDALAQADVLIYAARG